MPRAVIPPASPEERRLLGDYEPPSDGEGVSLLPQMAKHESKSRGNKPGAAHASRFYPQNSLNQPTGQLPLQSVRGDNVPLWPHDRMSKTRLKRSSSPINGSPPKRRKRNQMSASPSGTRLEEPISVDDEDFVSNEVIGTGQGAKRQPAIYIDGTSPTQRSPQTMSATSSRGILHTQLVSGSSGFWKTEDIMKPRPYQSAGGQRNDRQHSVQRHQSNKQAGYGRQRNHVTVEIQVATPKSSQNHTYHTEHLPVLASRESEMRQTRSSGHDKQYTTPNAQFLGSESASHQTPRSRGANQRLPASHTKSDSVAKILDVVDVGDDSYEPQPVTTQRESQGQNKPYNTVVTESDFSDELGKEEDDSFSRGRDIPPSRPITKPLGATEFFVKRFLSTSYTSRSPVYMRCQHTPAGLLFVLKKAYNGKSRELPTNKLIKLDWQPGSPFVVMAGSKDTMTHKTFETGIEFDDAESASTFANSIRGASASIKVVKRDSKYSMNKAFESQTIRLHSAASADPVDQGADVQLLEAHQRKRKAESEVNGDGDGDGDGDEFDLNQPKKHARVDAQPKPTKASNKKYENFLRGDHELQSQSTSKKFRDPGSDEPAQRRVGSMDMEGDETHRQAADNHVSVEVQPRPKRIVAERGKTNLPESLDDSVGATRRITRGLRSTNKSSSPLPLERYSQIHGLGDRWAQSVVYPMTGKGKANVNFEDLERLDDGEFLNDNLVEFGMRWAEKQFPQRPNKVYCFNTHFYTTLTSGKGRRVNYDAVKKWTKGIDIFNYDYILVPVNENMHWYLAIICHAGSAFSDPVVIDDSQETVALVETNLSSNKPHVEYNLRQVVQNALAHAKDEGPEKDQLQGTNIQPGPKLSPLPCDGMERMSLEDNIIFDSQDSEVIEQYAFRPGNPETTEKLGNNLDVKDVPGARTPATNEGTVARKSTPSPIFKRKPKRRSAVLRKYESDEPVIFILDSMGLTRPGTISNLKEYLIKEAEDKIARKVLKDGFKGANAKAGIPQQNNYYDCGVFVCGYIEKLMSDPDAFGRKLLKQEFDLASDWPDMNTSRMRINMRTRLQQLAKEQDEERKKVKAERQAAKKAAKTTPLAMQANTPKTSPPAASNPTTPKPTTHTATSLSSAMAQILQGAGSKDAPNSSAIKTIDSSATSHDDFLWDLGGNGSRMVAESVPDHQSIRKSPLKVESAPVQSPKMPSPLLSRHFPLSYEDDVKLIVSRPKQTPSREVGSDTLFDEYPDAGKEIVADILRSPSRPLVENREDIIVVENNITTSTEKTEGSRSFLNWTLPYDNQDSPNRRAYLQRSPQIIERSAMRCQPGDRTESDRQLDSAINDE